MLPRDRVAGIVILLFSLAVMWETRVLPLGSFHNPGPGYMPMLLAIVLGAMAILAALGGGGSPPLASLEWPEKRHSTNPSSICPCVARRQATGPGGTPPSSSLPARQEG